MTRCECAIDSRSNLCVICGDLLKKRPWKEFQKQSLESLDLIWHAYCCVIRKKKTSQSLLLFNIFRTQNRNQVYQNEFSKSRPSFAINLDVCSRSQQHVRLEVWNFSLEMIFIVGCQGQQVLFNQKRLQKSIQSQAAKSGEVGDWVLSSQKIELVSWKCGREDSAALQCCM